MYLKIQIIKKKIKKKSMIIFQKLNLKKYQILTPICRFLEIKLTVMESQVLMNFYPLKYQVQNKKNKNSCINLNL